MRRNDNMHRRHRVASLSQRLEGIFAERRKLILQLKELDVQARAVQLEHDTLWNLDAPTSNLPDEVLAMVFEAGMHFYKDSDFGALVSHVSRRWRIIALATARLWVNITFSRAEDRMGTIYMSLLEGASDAPLAALLSVPTAFEGGLLCYQQRPLKGHYPGYILHMF